MRQISAVICELNPLHEGHRYVFSKAKENSDILIAVMSGNFVQRGETAVYDKYKRAESALLAGADLVLELPFPYSSSSAEFFASAGVRIAEAAGATALYFGSECGDTEALKRAGMALDSDEYRNAMTVGRSAVLRSEVLKKLCPDLPKSLLDSPNDILGAEYCRRASIDTVAVKRISTDSASTIRKNSLATEGCDMLDPRRLFDLEFSYFRTQRSAPRGVAECFGGVGERLYKTAFETANSFDWMEKVKTKQYTDARLRRAALYALCGVSKEDIFSEVMFTSVLAMNKKGRAYLSALRKICDFPLLSGTSQRKNLSETAKKRVELSDFADSVYALCEGNSDPFAYIKRSPVIFE